ncbi:MAG: copper amine oxidase N-terminal domain-containing protein [Clostridia bacterium]|nr:copper amine oxidase N-terminal domain-containing protein [Clostridia bacterium]
MKKLLPLLMAFCLILSLCVSASDISIIVDGKALKSDVPPTIVEGRTMVPMRVIFEELGASVTWIPDSQMIRATYREKIIDLKIDAKVLMLCNVATGEIKRTELDVAPFITDGRTLVPVRAISEALGAEVGWDNDTRTVTIKSAK